MFKARDVKVIRALNRRGDGKSKGGGPGLDRLRGCLCEREQRPLMGICVGGEEGRWEKRGHGGRYAVQGVGVLMNDEWLGG